jgi:hypothetical protein
MLPKVLEDVHQRIPNLARRTQQTSMIAPVPHPPATPQHAVDRSGHANREALHTAGEPCWRICLHQQVEMIGLDAELEETEGTSRRRAKGAPDSREHRLLA